jgi:hypothetical protein
MLARSMMLHIRGLITLSQLSRSPILEVCLAPHGGIEFPSEALDPGR